MMNIFPDSGASICLAGPQHIAKLDLDTKYHITCHKQVSAAGGTKLLCKGWIPIKFQVGTHAMKQPVYICDHVDRVYFSKTGCMELNMLHPSFPKPMNTTVAIIIHPYPPEDHYQ